MRFHRFFIEEHLRNKKEIAVYEDDLIHQWKDVFRLRAGDKIILLDNSGFEYLSEVVMLAKGKAEIKIIDQSASLVIPKKEVWIFAALIKKDNFEVITEKGTEVGVSHFVPVLADRSEKKDINLERVLKIVREASEQSGRGTMPEVLDVIDLKDVFDLAEKNNVLLIAFDLDGGLFDVEVRETIKEREGAIGILIGPEGGWSEKEKALFKERGVSCYSLGAQVLRAETAGTVIPALILL